MRRWGGGKDSYKHTPTYKTASLPSWAPVPKRAPAPAPAPPPPPPPKPQPKPPEPIKHSPEIQQAKERVNKYQADIKSGQVSENIYAKGTYIAESSLNNNQFFDFSQNAFGNDQRKKA